MQLPSKRGHLMVPPPYLPQCLFGGQDGGHVRHTWYHYRDMLMDMGELGSYMLLPVLYKSYCSL